MCLHNSLGKSSFDQIELADQIRAPPVNLVFWLPEKQTKKLFWTEANNPEYGWGPSPRVQLVGHHVTMFDVFCSFFCRCLAVVDALLQFSGSFLQVLNLFCCLETSDVLTQFIRQEFF